MNEDTPRAGHNLLAATDPERLLVLAPEDFPALFGLQFPALVERAAELAAGCTHWAEAHPRGPRLIADDADNEATADFLRQLAGFAGATGEVEEARKRVKKPVFDAGKAIDAWFGTLRDPITAAIDRMSAAQTLYLREKAARERAERMLAEAQAAERAQRAAEAARQAVAEAAAAERATAFGWGDEATAEQAQDAASDALADARAAEETAAALAAAAAEPARDLVRSRSALGTTTTLADNWQFEVTDLRALCRAIAAGEAPAQFIQPAEAVIRAALRGKGGMRECPGLRIFNDQRARRTGGA